MTVLCDTNIVSELARPRPNPGVAAWGSNITSIALSVISLEEIIYGLSARPNQRIYNWFQAFLSDYCEIIPVTAEVAHRSGELRGTFRSKGITRSQADILIAATAQVHQLVLVTRNTRDFEDCGISLLNPFDD